MWTETNRNPTLSGGVNNWLPSCARCRRQFSKLKYSIITSVSSKCFRDHVGVHHRAPAEAAACRHHVHPIKLAYPVVTHTPNGGCCQAPE